MKKSKPNSHSTSTTEFFGKLIIHLSILAPTGDRHSDRKVEYNREQATALALRDLSSEAEINYERT